MFSLRFSLEIPRAQSFVPSHNFKCRSKIMSKQKNRPMEVVNYVKPMEVVNLSFPENQKTLQMFLDFTRFSLLFSQNCIFSRLPFSCRNPIRYLFHLLF